MVHQDKRTSHAHKVVWECCIRTTVKVNTIWQKVWPSADAKPLNRSSHKLETWDYVADIYQKTGLNPPRGFCPIYAKYTPKTFKCLLCFFRFFREFDGFSCNIIRQGSAFWGEKYEFNI